MTQSKTFRRQASAPNQFSAFAGQRPAGSQLIGTLLLIILLFALCVETDYVCGLTSRCAMIVANIVVTLLPLIIKQWNNTFDLFEPLVMADLSIIGMYVGRPLADIMTGHFHEHAYDIAASYNDALLLVLAGNLMFQLGYGLPLGKYLIRQLPKASHIFRERVAINWTVLISILGLLLFGIFLRSQGGSSLLFIMLSGRQTGGVGGDVASQSSAYLYNGISFLIPGATMLFAVFLSTGRRRYLALSIITFSPYILMQLAGGNRSGIIGLLFGLPMMWYIYRRKRPGLLLLLIAGTGIGLFFSFLREYRNTDSRNNIQLNSYTNRPTEALLQLFTSDDDEMFDVIAQELTVTPYWVPFRHFGVITDILVRAVPRTLWPDKPIEMAEGFFATMEPARFSRSRAGTATSILGDFYLDSGVPTVLFWMFIWGAILRGAWEWFIANPNSMVVLMIYSTIPPAVIYTFRGNFSNYFGMAFFTTLPLVIFAFLQRHSLRFR